MVPTTATTHLIWGTIILRIEAPPCCQKRRRSTLLLISSPLSQHTDARAGGPPRLSTLANRGSMLWDPCHTRGIGGVCWIGVPGRWRFGSFNVALFLTVPNGPG